jgi:hypothetical protein
MTSTCAAARRLELGGRTRFASGEMIALFVGSVFADAIACSVTSSVVRARRGCRAGSRRSVAHRRVGVIRTEQALADRYTLRCSASASLYRRRSLKAAPTLLCEFAVIGSFSPNWLGRRHDAVVLEHVLVVARHAGRAAEVLGGPDVAVTAEAPSAARASSARDSPSAPLPRS